MAQHGGGHRNVDFDEVVEEFDDELDVEVDEEDEDAHPAAAPPAEAPAEEAQANVAAAGAVEEPVFVDRERSRAYLGRALGSLSTLAPSLAVVVAQAQADAAALDDLGFVTVRRMDDLSFEGLDPEAILVVTVGVDEDSAQKALQVLGATNGPTILVVIVMPYEDGQPPPSPRTCVEHIRSMRKLREALAEAGASEVLCLMGGETLLAHRITEIIHQTAYFAQKTSDLISAEVAAIQNTAMRRLNQAHHRFLMMMPGRALENLPCVDTPLQEWRGETGALIGAGDFTFRTRLGSGAYGTVFKAEHPQYGICAVKVLAKRTITDADVLVSLNRELCQLLYAEPHPNIVRAHDVLHATHNFYVVMDYAGTHHLTNYVRNSIAETGESALSKEKVFSFAGQEASALAHLHNSLVCHRDVRPDNWIVSDDGTLLKLADFGLAIQLSGSAQQLRQGCGSLPFCAPEAYQSASMSFSVSSGHDGLAADMWSLGVNYLELLRGPDSVETMLDWHTQKPTEEERVIDGLRSITTLWQGIADEEPTAMSTTLSNLLILQPSERWRIGEVLGAQGLGAGRGI